MNEKSIIIKVQGIPKPWGLNKENKELEIDWRRNIKDECKKYKNRKIKEDVQLKIEITFYLNNKHIIRPDLDNLAKPVLDTICKISNPQGKAKKEKLYGAFFDYDDNRIFELILKKEERKEEGAIIKIWKI